MPELPEVETVCRGIAPFIEGQSVTKALTHRPNLRFDFPPFLNERLSGLSVKSVKRRAKYVLIELSDGKYMVIHLGMSGQVKVVPDYDGYERVKHDHMELFFDHGGALVYNDPRRFGFVLLFDDLEALNQDKAFTSMGPDPFSDVFTPQYLYESFIKKFAPMKSLLLDQRLVAGLGNIYVCEALFLAGIDPRRKGCDVEEGEVALLHKAILDVLKKAIKAGGSTLKDYRRADGKLGYFQNELLVYGREGELCNSCTRSEIERIVQSGRSSFYCPTCQR